MRGFVKNRTKTRKNSPTGLRPGSITAVRSDDRIGQHEPVVDEEQQEQRREDAEGDRPRQLDVPPEVRLQLSGDDDEQALSGDHRDAVERAAHADERRLLVLLESEHVETIRSDIVRRRAERHQPEDRERVLEERRDGDGERHGRQADAPMISCIATIQNRFVRNSSMSGLQSGLMHPGKVQPARVERDVGVGDARAACT